MVSNNLLDYTIQNMVINTTINHPKMVNPGTNQRFLQQNTDWGSFDIKTTDAVIKVDTTAARESMGLGQLSDMSMIKHYVEKGKQAIKEYAKRIVSDGNEVVKNRTTQVQLAKKNFMQLKAPGEVETAFYPAVPAEVDIERGTTDISYTPTKLNIDWANTEVVPYELEKGTVNFDIVRKAYVDFAYMGEPNYFPEPDFLAWA